MSIKLSELSAFKLKRVLCLFWTCFALNLPFVVYAQASESALTLPQAQAMMLSQHPQFKQFAAQLQAATASKDAAQLGAPLNLELETGELLGSGDYSGVKRAETTIALSSYLQLGGKRNARIQQSQSEVHFIEARREIAVRELMARLNSAFISALALQERCELAKQGAGLSQNALAVVKERVNRAAAAESEFLRAQVASIQAKLALSNCQVELSAALHNLAVSMGQETADLTVLAGDFYQLKTLPSWVSMQQELDQSPYLLLYNAQSAFDNAQLQVVQANNKLDIQWKLGVTHFNETDDAALTAGIVIPLFTGSRNKPELAKAVAQQAITDSEKRSTLQQLNGELFAASQRHTQARLTMQSLRFEAVPLLEKAYQQAQKAYQQGRYSYSEWVNAGQELLATQTQMIDAAEQAWLNQIAIERLVGR